MGDVDRPPGVRVEVSEAGGAMVITLAGRLDAQALPGVWRQTVERARAAMPGKIRIVGGELSYCDGAGLGLFAELRRIAALSGGKGEGERAGGGLEFSGLSAELQRLVDMSLLADPLAGGLKPVRAVGLVEHIGRMAWTILEDQRQLIAFVGELAVALLWSLLHPRRIRRRDLLGVAQKAGADALPVVSLLGLLVGVILAFQMAPSLKQFAAEHLIPQIVSFSIIRELGPLITAIIVAGRSGSAFAAEIGTMKVTEELAALKTLGIDPTRFLVVPRVLGAIMVTPLLAIYNMLLGLIGACLVMLTLGYSFRFFIHSVTDSIKVHDFLGGVFKSLVFALIVAGVGCLRGTQTKSGPGAVGDSATRAVVAGIVLTIVADAVLGVLFYYMGI